MAIFNDLFVKTSTSAMDRLIVVKFNNNTGIHHDNGLTVSIHDAILTGHGVYMHITIYEMTELC